MRKSKSLTADQFDAAISKLSVSNQTKEIAYGVLVEGKKQKEFCELYGMKRPSVSLAVSRVYNAYLANILPPEYLTITATLPKLKAHIVKKWEEEARDQLSKKI